MNALNTFDVAKCKCRNCDQKIEFARSRAGESVICPGCGMDTILFIPPSTKDPRLTNLQPELEEEIDQISSAGISRTRIKILVALFFTFSLISVGWAEFFSHPSPDEDRLVQEIHEQQIKDADLNDKYSTAVAADEMGKLEDILAQEVELARSIGTNKGTLIRLRTQRIQTSNLCFWTSVGLCVVWVPGVLYLFIVPKKRRQ